MNQLPPQPAKKALNYAVRADNVDELVSYLERFIEKMKIELDEQQESVENTIIGDPIRVKHKGRQPKRYKSGGEDLPKKRYKRYKTRLMQVKVQVI